MNISAAAKESGVPAKTIRYYESIGLIEPARRGENRYRNYEERDVEILRFIQRARRLGFALADVGKLLALWSDDGRSSADVKALALEHVAEVEARMRELASIRDTLLRLARQCHGDERPDCPILENLAGELAGADKHQEEPT